MISNKPIHQLYGLIAAFLCFLTYFILANLDESYSHFTNAFSELASVGQINNLWASLFGFLIPGILIFFFFINLPKMINQGKVRKYPFILMALSGLLMAIGASPMNYQDFSSVSSTLHIIGVMGGGLVFIIGAFTISGQLKKDENWKKFIRHLLIMTWLFIATGFFRESSLPGLAQKLGILMYYLYISFLSWNAYKVTKFSIIDKHQALP